jgi:ACS family tartrate transporter-like MFS transporter
MVAISVCATLAPFWAIPPTFLAGTAAAGGIALINAVGNLGGFAGPYVMGWAREETGSYVLGLAILATSMAIAAALVLALGRFRRPAFAS